jgi:hypothetical protein
MRFHSSTSNESARAAKRTRACARERTCALVRARSLTLASLIACTLLVSACDAQTNKGTPDESSGGIVNKVVRSIKGPVFSEPALRGKIIDELTQQPVDGAMVYGYYATQKGSLGGGKGLVDVVRSFETQTDASGAFEIPAWNSGNRAIDGDAMSLFPMIMIYKPGYEVAHQNLKSIREWQSATLVPRAKADIKHNGQLYDWTMYPHILRPLEKQAQVWPASAQSIETLRYWALSDSSRGMMNAGECGWEAYSRLLLVQHNELKDWYKRNLPAEALDGRGYAKDYGPLPNEVRKLSLVFKTAVDRLIENAQQDGKCKNPNTVFKERK